MYVVPESSFLQITEESVPVVFGSFFFKKKIAELTTNPYSLGEQFLPLSKTLLKSLKSGI